MRNGNESKKMAYYYYIDYYSLVISYTITILANDKGKN